MKTFSTVCPRNCYSACSFKVHVEDGRIVNIDPHPANKATPEGICLKGLGYVERAHSKDRILWPLKKNGQRKFVRIGWKEAIETIAEKLQEYKGNYGPQSILFYAASGTEGLVNKISYNFWKLFGGATTMYGNLCWPAGLEAERLTLGDNRHNIPWDIENAKLIVLWGKNPAETNIQQMVFIEKAQAKGAKLIIIDPRRTPSSERANLLIQPKPGTDGALALAVAKEIIDRGWTDMEFLSKYVIGFEEFNGMLEKWNISRAAEICEVPERYIYELAEAIGTIKPMTLAPGLGMQRFTNGGQTIRCLLALNIITANIGKPGSCFHYANLQGYVFDDPREPLSHYPFINPVKEFRRSVSMATLGKDILELKDPELKMIWVERGNPVGQNPETHTVLKALRGLEFRVVVEQFMTDTANEADIVLPAKNMFEQSDIISSYWNPYVQLKPKVVDPAGEVKPESEIYYLLAEKLGFNNEEILKCIPEPGNENIEIFLKEKLKKYPELKWEDIKEGPVIAPGLEEVAYADLNFPTISGKIELYSTAAAATWGVDTLPGYLELEQEEMNLRVEYPLFLLTPNTKNRIHSQFGNLDVIKQFGEETTVMVNGLDAEERGISHGEIIRIFNNRGEIQLKAQINFSIKRGCVVVYNGIWIKEGGTANFLSKARETDMGYGTAFHDNLVEIEKIS